MKQLILPSGKTLIYNVSGTSKDESSANISFTSDTDIGTITAIFNDKTDVTAILFDAVGTSTYADYTIFNNLSLNKTREYTVKLDKESLLAKIEILEEEKSELVKFIDSIAFETIPDIYERLDGLNSANE